MVRVVERADDVEQRVRVAQAGELLGRELLGADRPSDDAGGAGRSTYVTSAWTTFFGLKISVSRSSRSSGTLTTPMLSSRPPKPPVSAWPRVSVLKTVVLPDPASPTIAICTQ